MQSSMQDLETIESERAAESIAALSTRADAVFAGQSGRVAYGIPIGILMLEGTNIPFVPGDVGNAGSYGFPVRYELVPGATGDAVIARQDPAITDNFVAAARGLVAQGVRAITGDCGYMGAYQPAVAAAVPVPVFMSSLLQIPLALSMLRPEDKLAVIVANGETMTGRVLDGVGIGEAQLERCVIRGLEAKPHFRQVIFEETGELDLATMRDEVVERCREVLEEEPAVAAYLLECSDLPPYSAAVQRATGLPVFDWIAFIDYVQRAVVAKSHTGAF